MDFLYISSKKKVFQLKIDRGVRQMKGFIPVPWNPSKDKEEWRKDLWQYGEEEDEEEY